MRPAPPSIRPCSPILHAPQKVCVGGFFLGQGAHSSHLWKVCVGQKFYNALGRVVLGKKVTPDFSGATFGRFTFWLLRSSLRLPLESHLDLQGFAGRLS
jgi:hypothetical protein